MSVEADQRLREALAEYLRAREAHARASEAAYHAWLAMDEAAKELGRVTSEAPR